SLSVKNGGSRRHHADEFSTSAKHQNLPRGRGRRVLFQELHTFERNRFGRGSNVAPDGGRCRQFAQRETKALYRKPAVVTDVAKSLENFFPLHVAGTGNAAI